MPWAAVVFGWPAAIASIFLGVLGLMSGRWKWVVGGALAGSPFLLYLSLTPRFGWVAVLVAASYAGAVVATYRQRRRQAWLLFAPMLMLVAYVAAVVEAAQFR
jgi:hypothetical protein